MDKLKVIRAHDVEGYSPPGHENRYVSRMLVDGESVGSERLVVNHFTLLPGQSTDMGSHPAPYEEVYYILTGKGVVTLGGEGAGRYEVGPNSLVFIGADVNHEILNTGEDPLEMLTVMPAHMVPGANPLYDSRLRDWGTSFRQISKDGHKEPVP